MSGLGVPVADSLIVIVSPFVACVFASRSFVRTGFIPVMLSAVLASTSPTAFVAFAVYTPLSVSSVARIDNVDVPSSLSLIWYLSLVGIGCPLRSHVTCGFSIPLNFHDICVSCPIVHDCSLAGFGASTFGLTKSIENENVLLYEKKT